MSMHAGMAGLGSELGARVLAQPATQQAVTPSVGEAVAFWVCAVVAVVAALGLILSRSAVHGALLLAVDMICLAVLYAVQQAPFLAFVQVIVYTGAVMMLFLFVLMLVGVDSSDSLIETIRGQRLWVAVAGLGFGALLVGGVGNAVTTQAAGLAGANSAGNVYALARLLFTDYVFAFEATSALLITAAVGAMVLAHRERIGRRPSQQELSRQRFRGPRPSPLPGPGVFARHNAVDMPALLPDGSAARESVSGVIAARREQPDELEQRDDAGEADRRGRPRPDGGLEPGQRTPDAEGVSVPPGERDELDLPQAPGKGESE